MNVRYTWIKLFAAGTALVVLTSMVTALAMTGLERSRSQKAAQSAAGTADASAITAGDRSLPGFNASGDAAGLQSSLQAAQSVAASGLPPVSTASESAPAAEPSAPAPSSAPTPVTPSLNPTSAPTTARQTTRPTATDAIGSASIKAGTATGTSSTARILTASQAAAIAAQRIGTPGLRVIETEFEPGDYPPKYEVKLSDGAYKYEVDVHAVTGLILEVERERL